MVQATLRHDRLRRRRTHQNLFAAGTNCDRRRKEKTVGDGVANLSRRNLAWRRLGRAPQTVPEFRWRLAAGSCYAEGERTRRACRFQRPRWKHREMCSTGRRTRQPWAAVLPIPKRADGTQAQTGRVVSALCADSFEPPAFVARHSAASARRRQAGCSHGAGGERCVAGKCELRGQE